MTLAIRASIATAAHDAAAAWPLDSFIATNPHAHHESRPFDHSDTAVPAMTRRLGDYLADYEKGRITDTDLEPALLERVPELAGAEPVILGRVKLSAVKLAARELTAAPLEDLREPAGFRSLSRLDHLTAKWVAAFLDPDPLWRIPGHSGGLYTAFRLAARHDPELPWRGRRQLRALPDDPADTVATVLQLLGVSPERHTLVLRAELTALPGWVGHITWRAHHVGDIDLTNYLAVRLALRHALGLASAMESYASATYVTLQPSVWDRAERVARSFRTAAGTDDDLRAIAHVLAAHPPAEHALTWQRAYEIHYRDAVLATLNEREPAQPKAAEAAAAANIATRAQLLFCIDPRSEGLRRHLETSLWIDTIGVAGFFGVPVRFARHDASGTIDALPALLTPRHHLTENPASPEGAARTRSGQLLRRAGVGVLHQAEHGALTPFALAEGTGLLFGLGTLVRTLAPRFSGHVYRKLLGAVSPPLESTVTTADAFTPDERAALAETVLTMTGLTEFAPLIVITGHGSTSSNNLYESALQCGACGGHPGEANARAAAAVFNDQDVRLQLQERGITIPETTHFVAALHDTSTDTVRILDRHLIPASHRDQVARLKETLTIAGDALIRERAALLPGASPRHTPARLRRRATDWAEVYPELGLAGNASMIIGPRHLTRGINLGRRVFLHSYRAEADPTGIGLETILTAPMIVAQWINHQYYFSTMDPERYGAGTKTIHNAIGTLGVLSGGTGDLRIGLPRQSVAWGSTLLHEPMRLQVIIEAPLERIGAIISRNQVLRNLFDNQWIFLTARTDAASPWYHYTRWGWRAAVTGTTVTNGMHE